MDVSMLAVPTPYTLEFLLGMHVSSLLFGVGVLGRNDDDGVGRWGRQGYGV